MYKLPGPIAEALIAVADPDGRPPSLGPAVAELIGAQLVCADLSRALEGFREASRDLGILEESRSGQRIYDGWSRLCRFFLPSIQLLKAPFLGDGRELKDPPEEFEPLGSRWERTAAELVALLEEYAGLERLLGESPVSTHVGHRIRSRLLLLDRRVERVKIAVDLVHRDLALAARRGAETLAGRVAPDAPATGGSARGAP